MALRVIERGSVVRVRLSPTEGRELAGTRPALVVSATVINEKAEIMLVAPVTSKKVDRVYPFEVLLDHEACGLELPSKAMLNQMRAVSKGRILGVYGIADAETMDAVDKAIKVTLGLGV
ncbi:type II toxin-antitoxin system toxin endoribonuclease MazF9 [soil metagenome]